MLLFVTFCSIYNYEGFLVASASRLEITSKVSVIFYFNSYLGNSSNIDFI